MCKYICSLDICCWVSILAASFFYFLCWESSNYFNEMSVLVLNKADLCVPGVGRPLAAMALPCSEILVLSSAPNSYKSTLNVPLSFSVFKKKRGEVAPGILLKYVCHGLELNFQELYCKLFELYHQEITLHLLRPGFFITGETYCTLFMYFIYYHGDQKQQLEQLTRHSPTRH